MINKIRVGSCTSIIFTALVFVTLSFVTPAMDPANPSAIKAFQNTISIVAWVGVVPAFFVGYWLTGLRLRYFFVTVLNKYK